MLKKTLVYIISVFLVFTYVFILIRSFDTTTATEAYNLFYVDEGLKYYCSQEDMKNYYTFGSKISYTSEGNYKNQGKGWYSPEEDATWSKGNKSDYYIYLEHISDIETLTLKMEIVGSMGYDNELCINGNRVGEIIINDNWCSIEILNSVLKEGINEFSIVTDEEVLPYNEISVDSSDTRELNLMIKTILVE